MSDSQRFSEILQAKVSGFMSLDASTLGQLWSHYELLRHWNARLNLTSVIEMEKAAVRHYAESLFLASFIPSSVLKIADVGSGAGFPGFPVAVRLPDAVVFLIESDQRKAAFLREASDVSRNIRVCCMRAPAMGEKLDAVVGRAVRPAEILDTARRNWAWVGILLSRKDANQLATDHSAQVHPLPWDEDSAALVHSFHVEHRQS